MESGIEEKISGILSSPEDLKKIMDIVGALGAKNDSPIETNAIEKSSESVDENLSAIEKVLRNGKNERTDLLTALKPFLKDGKRDKVDSLLKLINTAELLISAKKFL